jgi:Zn-finger nucleic acid-binding protein
MKCPVCHEVRMKEVDKNGVHIDVCPDCKGVWLDRGELEKLMQGIQEVRKELEYGYREQEDRYRQEQKYEKHDPNYDSKYPKYDSKYPKYKKKNSIFEVFDDLF